jgi:hypothetical protein
MHELDFRLNEIAARNHRLLTRAVVLGAGGTDQLIHDRLGRGQWSAIHPGVYLVGVGPLHWIEKVAAARLAAGDGATASRRAALLLWRLDGIVAAPVELNVPFGRRAAPVGAIVHRTRRIEPTSIVDGIPVTSVEQSLLESAVEVPPVVTEKAFASAWRRNLTSPEKCERYLEHHGGRGRQGTSRLREVLAIYAGAGRAPGSDGEVAFLRVLRAAGIEEPVRQFVVDLGASSKATIDFAWPLRRKLVEFVSLRAHAGSRALAADTLREDDILAATGWELRRFAPETLRRHPEEVARRVRRFLCT